MLVREFTDLVIDASFTVIKVFDNDSHKDIVKCCIDELSENILDATIDSWDIE